MTTSLSIPLQRYWPELEGKASLLIPVPGVSRLWWCRLTGPRAEGRGRLQAGAERSTRGPGHTGVAPPSRASRALSAPAQCLLERWLLPRVSPHRARPFTEWSEQAASASPSARQDPHQGWLGRRASPARDCPEAAKGSRGRGGLWGGDPQHPLQTCTSCGQASRRAYRLLFFFPSH